MCKWCPWYRVLVETEALLLGGRVAWANGYLESVITAIKATKHVTPGQQKALLGLTMQAERKVERNVHGAAKK